MKFLKIFKNKKKRKIKNKSNIKDNDWPDHVTTLDEKNFNDFIDKYPLSLVDFWAPWCKPCKTIAPRIRRLSKKYKGRVAFGRLNTSKHEKLAKQYKIKGIPHLIFFHYGKQIASLTGVKPISNLNDAVEDLLNKI